ncbi:hypothetical protein MMC30_002808 [Trapelia coarctata]|nr:hypothetical protein [Trapelia coarctata]
MARPVVCCDRLHKPTQLDLSRIDPASFVNIDLPTRRAEVSPPPPPSSPRFSTGQQGFDASDMSPDRPLVQVHSPAKLIYDKEHSRDSFYQSIPSMDLELPNPRADERSIFDCQSESCVSEINSTTQVDSWSQCCSSSSDTETDKGPFVLPMPSQNSQDINDLSNVRSLEWPAYTTFSYPTDRRVSLPPSALMVGSHPMLPSTLRTRQKPNPPIHKRGPSVIAYSDIGSPPLQSYTSHSTSQPCTPMMPAYPDLNERSFMDFDDSESENRDRPATKASSLSRLFDQKRKGHRRRGFGRSISDVFSSFSCAK